MLREIIKVNDKLIIDPAKHYRNRNDVMIGMNASKLKSPIVLIDPTYKERNALAALSQESFSKFQKASRDFLKKPSLKFFEEQEIVPYEIERFAKSKRAEFLHVILYTDRQAGDIAGTKLKKFHYFLENEIRKYFELLLHRFSYDDNQKADLYLVVKQKKEIIRKGPPLGMRKETKIFKRLYKNTFVKDDRVYTRIKLKMSGKEFIKKMAKDKKQLMEMGITKIEV